MLGGSDVGAFMHKGTVPTPLKGSRTKSVDVIPKWSAISLARVGEKLGVSRYQRWIGRFSLPLNVTSTVVRPTNWSAFSSAKSVACFT